MDNKTIGIVAALAGVVTFFYSFGEAIPKTYFWVGLGLMIGGLLWSKYVKD